MYVCGVARQALPLVLLLLPLLLFSCCCGQNILFPTNEAGTLCQRRLGRDAPCVPIQDCPSTLQSYPEKQPVICGRSGNVPRVCCTDHAEPGAGLSTSPPVATLHDISKPANYDNLGCGRGGSRKVSEALRPRRAVDNLRNVWPWMALLGTRQNTNVTWFCGGVLINQRWVLTAAHCFNFVEINVVRFGEDDYEDSQDGAVTRDVGVEQVVLHPQYRHPLGYHDLALIKVSADVAFVDLVWPACLAWGKESRRNVIGHKVILTGWGDTQYGGFPSSALQEVALTVYSAERCDEQYSVLPFYSHTFPDGLGEDSLCAGYPNGGRDACQGDSGGPIVALNGTGLWARYTVAGIVSRGYGCGHQDFFGLYANLRHPPYLGWIKSVAFQDPITVSAPAPSPLLPHVPPQAVSNPGGLGLGGFIEDISAPVNYDHLECGVSTGRNLLTGEGEESTARGRRAVNTVRNVWPWMVALWAPERTVPTFCSGVLLNREWVLTAGHCMHYLDSALNFTARLRVDNLVNVSDGPQPIDVHVARVVYHPDYEPPVTNDLALLQLAAPIKLEPFVRPVCLGWGLESTRNLLAHMVTLTGWGYTGERSSASLQEVKLTVLPCTNSRFGNANLCAGEVGGGRDACMGDSGSPIVSLNSTGSDGRYFVAGIVSWGPTQCGKRGTVGNYVNLRYPPYLAWIKQVAFTK